MSTRLRPPGFGAPARPRSLGSGLRLRRDRSLTADAQRRYRAAAEGDDRLSEAQLAATPTPSPSPPPRCRAERGSGAAVASSVRAGRSPEGLASANGGGEHAVLGEREEAECGEREADQCTAESEAFTPLSIRARALYEGGVVPVCEVARLCAVSVPGLYYHIRKQGWRRRRPSTPRDPKKAERQRQRRAAAKAALPPRPRGLKARDPQGQTVAVALCERASELSQAALSRALARRDAEADVRVLSILARALRDIAAIANAAKPAMSEPAPEIDAKRSALAQRIDALVRERAAMAASAPSVPPAADQAPVKNEAPLSEADRRINAVAARFYAKQGATALRPSPHSRSEWWGGVGGGGL